MAGHKTDWLDAFLLRHDKGLEAAFFLHFSGDQP